MKAYETTFQTMVEGTKQFQIPLYQRTYSWGQEELDRLWDDLWEQVEADRAGTKRGVFVPEHFMGSVVLAPGTSAASDMTRWLVVDGQQRLTSLTIALAAIRDRLRTVEERPEEGDPTEADRVHNTYLVNQYKKRLDRYRVLPTQADRDAFTAVIDSRDTAGGRDTIGRAYNFFQRKLMDFDEPDLLAIEAVIGRRLSLVEIQADMEDNVFRIFESLNDTGKKLSQTDLLRNYVFMLLPTIGEEVYDEVWLPMQEELGPETLELLAWLDLILRGDDRAKQSEVYRGQQRRLEKVWKQGGEEAIRAELEQLRRLGQLLLCVVEPETEDDDALRGVLTRLVEWGNTIYQPLALHLLLLRANGAATTEELVEALGYVESFLVRRMIAGVANQGLNRTFKAVPTELETDRPVAEAVHRYLSHERRRWPSDRTLTEVIATRNFYWSGRPAQRVYVLRRLEESYAAAEPVDFNKAKLTIEHVMPQKLTSEWEAELRTQAVKGEDPHELHGRLLHTLGNLTLSAQNAKLSNHPFQRKQQILDASALSMNREIADAPVWGSTAILGRAARLAERAVKLWPAPLPGGAELEDERHTWQLLRHALAELPAGNWTSFADIARLVGTSASKVGAYISSGPTLVNAHRVLSSDGETPLGFAWPDGRQESLREVLEKEGVIFTGVGADPEQRLDTQALAELAGLDSGSGAADSSPEERRAQKFRGQLAQHQEGRVIDAIHVLVEHWRSLGGDIKYGTATETSGAFQFSVNGRPLPFFRCYPVTGTVEVVFSQLARRQPFDDLELRRELRSRLNELPGVAIPGGRLSRLPSFPMESLSENTAALREVFDWCRKQVRNAL